MAVPWKVMTKIRHAVMRECGWTENTKIVLESGEEITIEEKFFTLDRDSNQIVSNITFKKWHFIFDLEGNLIKKHQH